LHKAISEGVQVSLWPVVAANLLRIAVV